MPDGVRKVKEAGSALGTTVSGSVVLIKNTTIDVLFDPVSGDFGLFFTLGGEIPGGAMSRTELVGEVARITSISCIARHVSFGLSVSNEY